MSWDFRGPLGEWERFVFRPEMQRHLIANLAENRSDEFNQDEVRPASCRGADACHTDETLRNVEVVIEMKGLLP